LRIQYLAGICRILLRENVLSIFAIELMEKTFSGSARLVRNRDQALHIFSLILNLRVELQTRLAAVERELAAVPPIVAPALTVHMEFERTFARAATDQYLSLLGSYSHISDCDILVTGFEQGSTTLDFVILTAASLPSVLRFLKCSLSMATVTLKETTKFRNAYKALTGAPTSRRSAVSSPKTKAKRNKVIASPDILAHAIIGSEVNETRSLQIFVDTAKEKVLVVDGTVTVTISLGQSA
jgi:hypothetical protein